MSPKPAHARATDILIHRRGQWSRVVLADGRACLVYDLAWGYDAGDEVAHMTTNCDKPEPPEPHESDFFFASEIVSIEDRDTGGVLFELTRDDAPPKS